MFDFLQRLGFPPFNRSRQLLRSASAVRRTHRIGHSEHLEPRALMAVDSSAALGTWSIFAALSRGHGGGVGGSSIVDSSATAPAAQVSTDTGVQTASGVSSSGAPSSSTTIEVDDADHKTTFVSSAPVSAVAASDGAEGEEGDVTVQIGANTSVVYNRVSGSLRMDTTVPITTLEIVSKTGIFDGDPAQGLGAQFDVDTDFKIFKINGFGFNTINFGNVARKGLTEAQFRADVSITGTPHAGGLLSSRPVEFVIQPTDLQGNAITSINLGQEFLLRIQAKDIRSSTIATDAQKGLFSAYIDVTYDATLADAVANSITYGTRFTTAKSGSLSTDGLIDEIGAINASLTPTGPALETVATVRMKATKGGTLRFSGNGADSLPNNELLVYNGTARIPEYDVKWTESSLTIVDVQANDLVAFAKALATAGVKFYGAGWCPHCTAQKERFEDGQSFLPFIESTNPDQTPNQIAIDNNIQSYPTWVFPNGTRLVGEQTLEAISTAAGIPIPTSSQPFVKPIDNTTVLAGSPLMLPIDGYDPNGGTLTYTVTSSNPNLVAPTLQSGNRNMLVDVEGFGKLLFQLFDDKAPRVTEQITTLIEDEFYDGLKFHRILNNFVIQGGDPLGNGSGGSDLPDFDDQFHIDLQHNRTGLLSMAKTTDDTNNSQFFITEGPSRHLDFNHSIFGVLIEGESNRDNISNTAVKTSAGEPKLPVTMKTVRLVNDTENALMMLKATPGQTGTATITVTARDPQGNEFVETFDVTVAADTTNGGPFLDDIGPLTTPIDTPLEFTLTSKDVEGDAVTYSVVNGTNLTLEVNATTGKVKATPKAGFVGTATGTVRVAPATTSGTQDKFDSQIISVKVQPATPTVDLVAASDTGISNTDNITKATSLEFLVTGVTSGATVEILSDGQVVGTGTASGTSITITTANIFGDGNHAVTARQKINGEASNPSATLTLRLDQTAPVAFTSTAPTTGTTQTQLQYNAQHPEEGTTGFRYSLTNAPTGAQINAETGAFTWTPTSAQVGANSFAIVATDAAGNTRSQDITVNVASLELLQFRLQTSNSGGQLISAVATGQTFDLQVYVKDLRDASATIRGVFSAYLDVLYPNSQIAVNGAITYSPTYADARTGTTNTAGVIDDAGATAGTNPLGANEFLLFSVPMKATAAGNVTFTSTQANIHPLLETTLYGLDTPLAVNQMSFGTTNLQIVDATFAADDTISVLEDSTATTIRVLDNDIAVPTSATLSISAVTNPANGTVSRINNNSQIQYTPNANFQGVDTFTYTITDSNNKTSTATVRVTVTNVNDNPTAVDDTFNADEDATNVSFDPLANDSAAPDAGETLTISAVGTTNNGTVTISTDKKKITYTPKANFSGTDTFTYTLSDGNGGTDQGQITVNVKSINDAPVATADTKTTPEDTPLTFNVSDLLANDNGGPSETNQTVIVKSVSNPSGGSTVSLNGNQVTFTPPANFVGTLTFSYVIEDNGTTGGTADAKTATGTVTVTVTSVNDNPTAVNDTAATLTGSAGITINVLANDTSTPDTGETLTVSAVGTPSNGGTVTIGTNGQLNYKPAAGFAGTETFTYTLSDGNGGTAQGTVTVTVTNFVQGGVKGLVFVDSNGDGQKSTSEQPLAGVPVRLAGTDNAGKTVNLTANTDSTGTYHFAEVAPGSYTVTQEQPGFTSDGNTFVGGTSNSGVSSSTNSFRLNLTSDGIANSQLNFSEKGLQPVFSIWDALASRGSSGFHASVHATDGQQWARLEKGWENVDVVSIRFTGDMTAVEITIREGSRTRKTTIPRTDRSRVQVIGQDGQDYLIRIQGAKSSFTFTDVTA